MQISRRNTLMGAAAVAATGAVPVAAMASSKAKEPLVTLWQERTRLRVRLDRTADQIDAIEATFPEGGGSFTGIMIQVRGCKPRTCLTTKQIDTAMRYRSLFSLDAPSEEVVSAWLAEGKAQRDAWVMELEKTRQRYHEVRRRSGLADKEAEYDAIWEDAKRIEGQIMDTPAHSIAGIAIKLRLAAYYTDPGKEGPENLDWDQRIMFNALHNAERLAGEAAS